MTDFTTDVTVTIHGSEIDLVAVANEIFPAEPDVGVMSPYIDEWGLLFADGTWIPGEWYELFVEEELQKVQDALNDALARGDFEPDPDYLREERDERRRTGLMLEANPFKPGEAK